MKINKITDQDRRDFQADYECEGCGHIVNGEGYDDAYFHQNVIPKMRCPVCGKTSAECGVEYRPLMNRLSSSDFDKIIIESIGEACVYDKETGEIILSFDV